MEMNRTEKFVKNVIFSMLLSLVTMIVGFILPKIMLSYYGSEVNGLVSSITQFISYFTIVEVGIAQAAIFALYKPLAEKDHDKTSAVVSTAKNFYHMSGYIFLSLVIILSIAYPLLIKNAPLDSVNITLLVLIIGVSGVLDFFTLSKYRVLLTADQKLYVISISTIIYLVLNTIIIYIFSSLKFGIVLVRFIALFAILSRSLILLIFVKRKYNHLNFKLKPQKDLLKKRWDALYLQILGTIQNGAPYVILTLVSNLVNVSIYAIYNMIMMGVNNLLSVFIAGLSASFGEVISKNNTKVLKQSYREFEYVYYDILTIFYSMTMVLIIPFIRLFTKGITDANYILPTVAVLFVLNGLFYNLKTPQGMLIHSAGLYKETKIQTTIQGLIIVVLGIILTPSLNIVGILIASIASNIYRIIDLTFFVPKNITKLTIKPTVLRYIKVFISGLLIIFSCNRIPIRIDSYSTWLFFAFISFIVSVIIILIIDALFERKMMKLIFIRIRTMLKRIKNGKNRSSL